MLLEEKGGIRPVGRERPNGEDNPDLAGSPDAAAQTMAPDRTAKRVASRDDGRACGWQAGSEVVIRH